MPQRNLLQSKLSRKLVGVVIIIGSLVSVFSTAIQLGWLYHLDRDKIDETLELVEQSYMKSLAESIWAFDNIQIQNTLDGIVNIPTISYVKLDFENETYESGQLPDRNVVTKKFPITYRQEGNAPFVVGDMYIVASLDQVYRSLLNQAYVVLISNLVKTLIVALLILYLFHRIVSRHLVKMTQFFEEFDPAQPTKGDLFELDRSNELMSSTTDEIDSMAKSINTNALRLNQSHIQISRELKSRLIAERKLQNLNDNLESKVYHRTNTILEQRKTIKNLETLKSMGELAGGVAHEINNPLAVIDGYIRVIKKNVRKHGVESSEINKAITKMSVMIDRIAKIVSSLRTFSKDGSREPFRAESVSAILDSVLVLGGERYVSDEIRFQVVKPAEDFTVDCRLPQVLQAILHLIQNARQSLKEKPSESKWIRIEIKKEGEFAVFRITDSGPQIPHDVQMKMLQPFFTTQPIGSGSGLGLSVCKGLAEAHGGSLEYDSEVGTPSFILRLKVDQSQRFAA